MKVKKGFTLIELLAVIVILAVIALIATPIVLNIIENARYGAAKSSAISYVEASEKSALLYMMDNKDKKVSGSCSVSKKVLTCENEITLNLDIKGSLPSEGTIIFDDRGNVIEVKELLVSGYKFNYKNKEWVGVKDDGKDKTPPEVISLSGSTTVDSITVVLSCKDEESEIEKIEFKKDSGEWENNGSNPLKIYEGLESGKSYHIEGRCTNKEGLSSETSEDFVTDTLTTPGFEIDKTGWQREKTLTIKYSGRGERTFEATGEYEITSNNTTKEGEIYKVEGDTVTIKYKSTGSVTARVKEGSKEESASYSLEQIDNVIPEVEITPTVEGTPEWKTAVSVKGKISKKGISKTSLYECITESDTCDPIENGSTIENEGSVSLSDGENIRKICFQAQNEVGTKSEIECSEAYKVDSKEPNITATTESVEITEGTDKETSSYFTVTWGISGTGTISCTPENVKTLSVGDSKEISCTATGLNGKTKTATKNIKVNIAGITPSLSTHFGKYVNYTPDDATWSSSKLTSYGVAETEDKTQGKFNIFDETTNASATGKAKSQSITCYSISYANKYNGWRVLDVSSSGQITLIHAGTPECYYHGTDSSTSVKILETASTSSSPGESKAWTKYGNATYATSVHYMTNEDFNLITYQINKNNNYTITDNGESNSTCYYKSSSTPCGYDNDMIDIGSYYWLASAYNTDYLYYWAGYSSYRYVGTWIFISGGVRPVVVLKSGVKFKDDGKTGTSESNALNLVI